MSEPPVALLHGFATSARRTWVDDGWVDLLADAGREVVAPDLLGHGDAPKPHDPRAYEELEARVLDALPPVPVDAVGFSLGARTLLVLASRHPDRFRRLVVAGVGANLLRPVDSAAVADALEAGGPSDDPWLGHLQRLASAPGADPLALAALLRRQAGAALGAEALARVTAPVLVVLGDRDWAGPADPLVALLPDARLEVLPGVDHFATPRSPAFVGAALAFLGAEAPAPRRSGEG